MAQAGYGEAGFSMLDLAIAAEELTRVDVNVPTTLLATGLGLQPVIQYGSPEQKERFLRPFADDPEGDLLASYAFTDVAGGPTSIRPTRPAGGHASQQSQSEKNDLDPAPGPTANRSSAVTPPTRRAASSPHKLPDIR